MIVIKGTRLTWDLHSFKQSDVIYRRGTGCRTGCPLKWAFNKLDIFFFTVEGVKLRLKFFDAFALIWRESMLDIPENEANSCFQKISKRVFKTYKKINLI